MDKNPYSDVIYDESSDTLVKNINHEIWETCHKATLQEVGEWLERNTSVWAGMGLDSDNKMMVFTISAEFANKAIQSLKKGEMAE